MANPLVSDPRQSPISGPGPPRAFPRAGHPAPEVKCGPQDKGRGRANAATGKRPSIGALGQRGLLPKCRYSWNFDLSKGLEFLGLRVWDLNKAYLFLKRRVLEVEIFMRNFRKLVWILVLSPFLARGALCCRCPLAPFAQERRRTKSHSRVHAARSVLPITRRVGENISLGVAMLLAVLRGENAATWSPAALTHFRKHKSESKVPPLALMRGVSLFQVAAQHPEEHDSADLTVSSERELCLCVCVLLCLLGFGPGTRPSSEPRCQCPFACL